MSYDVTGVDAYLSTAMAGMWFLVASFPFCHLLYHVWYKEPRQAKAAGISRHPTKIKMDIIVTISITSYMIHITSHLYFLLVNYIPFGLSHFGCQVYVFNANIFYYLGKATMFIFFVLRAWLTFKNTHNEYSQSYIICISSIIILAHVGITYAFMGEWMPIIDARDTNIKGGRICVNPYNETNDFDINLVLLLLDAIMTILFGAITLHMLISKLFQLAHVAARQRGAHKFRFQTIMSTKVKSIDSMNFSDNDREHSRDSTYASYNNDYEAPPPQLGASNSVSTHSVLSTSSIRGGSGSEMYETKFITKKGSKRQYVLKRKISASAGMNDNTNGNTNEQNYVASNSTTRSPMGSTSHTSPVVPDVIHQTSITSLRKSNDHDRNIDPEARGRHDQQTSNSDCDLGSASDEMGITGDGDLVGVMLKSQESINVNLSGSDQDTHSADNNNNNNSNNRKNKNTTTNATSDIGSEDEIHDKNGSQRKGSKARGKDEEIELKIMGSDEEERDKISDMQISPRLMKATNSAKGSISNNKIKVKGLSPDRDIDVKLFHKFTQPENKILILCIKLILLIIIASISSLASFFLWESGVGSVYAGDSAINIFCTWLALSMANEYYLRIFGGKKWNSFMFPYIKMYALTCCGECYGADVYIVDETEIHDNKGICGCCDESTVLERKRVLELSRKEYIMMQEKEEKKLNKQKRRAQRKQSKQDEIKKKKQQQQQQKQQQNETEKEKAQKEEKEEKERQQKKEIAKSKRNTFNNPNKMTADI